MKKESGFTLVELMIVVAILAVLVALSIPHFGRFVARSSRVEAITILNGIHKHQMSYFADNGQFYPPDAPTPIFYINLPAEIEALHLFFGLNAQGENHGWEIQYSVNRGSLTDPEPLSKGFGVSLTKDLDNLDPDILDDRWVIQVHGFMANGCPDHIPVHFIDEYQDVIADCFAF